VDAVGGYGNACKAAWTFNFNKMRVTGLTVFLDPAGFLKLEVIKK